MLNSWVFFQNGSVWFASSDCPLCVSLTVVLCRCVLQNGCSQCAGVCCVAASHYWPQRAMFSRSTDSLEHQSPCNNSFCSSCNLGSRLALAQQLYSLLKPGFYRGSVMKGCYIASQRAALYRYVLTTEAFFCRGCDISKAVIAGCHVAEVTTPVVVKLTEFWWGKGWVNISGVTFFLI